MIQKFLRLVFGASSGGSSTTLAAAPLGYQQLFGSPIRAVSTDASQSIVIVGNCIAEGIQAGMSAIGLSKAYRFTAVPLHLRSLESADSRQALSSATHVFAQRLGVVDWDKLRSLAAEAVIYQFPDVVLRSPWPFDGSTGFKDDFAASMPSDKIRHQDGALGRLRQLEPDKKKRIACYRQLNLDFASQISRVIEAQDRFLLSVDEGSDIKLGKFICENYKRTQLFYDPAHPSGLLFQKLCEGLSEKLKLSIRTPPAAIVDGWKDWSVPVHPAIANQLGLDWATETTRYRYTTLGDVTWQEWVEAYIETFG